MSIAIRLPAINGPLVTGLAATAEQALLKNDKLEVVAVFVKRARKQGESEAEYARAQEVVSLQASIEATILTLFSNEKFNASSEQHKSLMIAAVAVLMSTGNIAHIGNAPDGDWYPSPMNMKPKFLKMVNNVEEPDTDRLNQIKKMVEDACNPEMFQKVATLICATKVNWFKTNHHTGAEGNSVMNYTRKTINIVLGTQNFSEHLSVVHRIGHWASTKHVLTQLGVKNIEETSPLIPPTADVKFEAAYLNRNLRK